MEHNSSKLHGENIDIFSYATNIYKFKMYKIGNDGVLYDITPDYEIISIGQDLSKVNVTLPSEDTIVCCVFNEQPIVLRVGKPDVRYIFYTKYPQDYLPYTRVDTIGNLIEAGNLEEYGVGFYGFVPSDLVYSIINVKGVITPLAVPYDVNKACGNDGTILLQRGVWQMIAIPVDANVYDGFLNRLEEQSGVPIADLIEVVNCYRGDLNKFLSFVPGLTNYESIHNFPLTYKDNESLEIVAMWVKCKQWIHTADDVVFEWET